MTLPRPDPASLTRARDVLAANDDPGVRRVGDLLAARLAGEIDDLDQALGLVGSSDPVHLARRAAFAERRRQIRHAADMSGFSSTKLERAYRRYYATAWQADQREPTCPERIQGTMQEHFWYALKAVPHTLSDRSIRVILGNRNHDVTATDLRQAANENEPAESVDEVFQERGECAGKRR